jgi:hypothetical protein
VHDHRHLSPDARSSPAFRIFFPDNAGFNRCDGCSPAEIVPAQPTTPWYSGTAAAEHAAAVAERGANTSELARHALEQLQIRSGQPYDVLQRLRVRSGHGEFDLQRG